MASFTNISPDDLDVYVDGLARFVAAGDSFDVPDSLADGYRQQPNFSEVVAVVLKKTDTPTPEISTPIVPAVDSEGAL